MPPIGPLRKDDGPACRVCGCTEHNACVLETGAGEVLHGAVAKSVRMPAHRMPRVLTCSWVRVSDSPRHLCSACAGTAEDALECLNRASKGDKSASLVNLRYRLLKRKIEVDA